MKYFNDKKILDFADFIETLNIFSRIYIEMAYPSNLFKMCLKGTTKYKNNF